MSTPKGRLTRSNSNNNASITLQDIHNLITAGNKELLTTMKSELEKMNHALSSLTLRVRDIEEKLDDYDTRMSKHETELQEIKEDLKKSASNACRLPSSEELCREATLRLQKRKYLIISGLPEQTTGSMDDRLLADKIMVTEIASLLGEEDFSTEEVSRIGKIGPQKSRLLRFKCSSQSQRTNLLKNAKQLKLNSKFSSVYLSPDQTLIQRQLQKALRDELAQKRSLGLDVIIRNGRVVDRNVRPQNFQRSF